MNEPGHGEILRFQRIGIGGETGDGARRSTICGTIDGNRGFLVGPEMNELEIDLLRPVVDAMRTCANVLRPGLVWR